MLAAVLLASCSTTRNLPEDEVLYVGTSAMHFDGEPVKKSKKNAAADTEEGVIRSLADAYETVGDLLTNKGGASADVKVAKAPQPTLTPAQRDSAERMQRIEREAFEEVKDEVKAALACKPNNALLGSSSLRSPLAMGLWMYNRYVNSTSRFGRWMFNTFAATPVLMSTVNPEMRTRVAQNTLRNYGYFRGAVDFEVLPQKNPRKAKLTYDVHPGALFRLDSVAYMPFPTGLDSLVRATLWQRKLWRGAPFNVSALDAERVRLNNLFRNNGYYYHKPEYIVYRADTVQRPQFVQLQVVSAPDAPARARQRFSLGRTHVTLFRYDDLNLTDSLRFRDFTFRYAGTKNKPPLRFGSMRRYINYRKGEVYCQDEHNGIAERLSSMGVFSQVNVKYVPRDTTETCDTLDVYITAMLDKPYDSEFETKVTSKSNGQVGPGVSFGMAKRNAFRGAEKLKFEIHGSYEWQTGANIEGKSSMVNSYEYGTTLSLDYPRLVAPWFGRRLSRRSQASTSFSLDANWMNRSGYFGMVSLGARVGYTYQRRRTVKHEFVPFRLDYDELLHTTAAFDSVINANQALYVSMRNQFVPSMRYTFTYSSVPTARNPRSFIFEVKESGNVTSGLFAAFGQPFGKRDKKLFGVPFAQFIKCTAEFRDAFKLGRRSYLATRVMVGAVYSYGNSTTAPYNDLFSVGGANSIRAFAVRGVGPGAYHPGNSNYSYIDQLGDVKFEANVEYRFPIVSSLYGAVFVDAGNVWLMNSDPARPGGTFRWSRLGRDLALGSGVGVRYDLDFLVLRFDVGVGVHSPYDTGKKGYYNMPKFFDSLGYHFAVGYPF